MRLKPVYAVVLAALPALLSACAAGPDYRRPAALPGNGELPAAYKELAGWKPAQPGDELARGKWWQIFGDPLLDSLQEQLGASNQELVQAAARYRAALALLQSARAAYFPNVNGEVAVTHSRAASNGDPAGLRPVVTGHILQFGASWEADLWGRIGRAVEAGAAGAQAGAADLENVRLLLQAELAQSYFQLRALDAQTQLLQETIAGYEKSLQLSQNQYNAGIVSKADVVQARTQLKTTQAQLIDVGVQRAQLEHAIAVLVGQPPASFSVAAAPLTAVPPPTPAGLPSALLERRPDIAAAERRMAQANALIGVAQSAYFPSLTLSPAVGYQSASMAQWLTAPSRFWSVGAALTGNLFDGGARRAQTAEASAAYEANVASYRQTVLAGLAEVENNLAALRILEQEAEVHEEALRSARESVLLTTNQYKAGTVSYLNVVTVQVTALSNERTSVDIRSRRLAASVQLIRALGGGWNTAALPSNRMLLGAADR